MILVEVRTFGDFECIYTDVIMVAPDTISKAGAKTIIKEIEKRNQNSTDTAPAIKQLEGFGFKVVNGINLTVGGNT